MKLLRFVVVGMPPPISLIISCVYSIFPNVASKVHRSPLPKPAWDHGLLYKGHRSTSKMLRDRKRLTEQIERRRAAHGTMQTNHPVKERPWCGLDDPHSESILSTLGGRHVRAWCYSGSQCTLFYSACSYLTTMAPSRARSWLLLHKVWGDSLLRGLLQRHVTVCAVEHDIVQLTAERWLSVGHLQCHAMDFIAWHQSLRRVATKLHVNVPKLSLTQLRTYELEVLTYLFQLAFQMAGELDRAAGTDLVVSLRRIISADSSSNICRAWADLMSGELVRNRALTAWGKLSLRALRKLRQTRCAADRSIRTWMFLGR